MSSNADQSSTFAGGIIAPLSVDNFFEQYWEKKPLHIERSASDQFSHLISERVIETLLSTHELAFPSVQLSKTGEVIPVEDYTDANRMIVNERIVERYKAGCTVVMSHAHKLHPALMEFCREVQSGMSMPCQANVYLSPPGNQGFNPHHDTHDVFILQVSGKKTFSFYGGGAELPTVADRFNKSVHSVGDKTEEIQLSAGDTLYIPRGFVHDAVADAELASLHITLGVYPMLMHTLASQIIQSAMQTDTRLRASVMNPSISIGSSAKQHAKVLKELLQEHITEQVITDAISELEDDYALGAKQNIANLFSSASNTTLTASTELAVNSMAVVKLERNGKAVKLRTHGAVLAFQAAMGEGVEWVLGQKRVIISEIPHLNIQQQLALVEQLLDYSVLERL